MSRLLQGSDTSFCFYQIGLSESVLASKTCAVLKKLFLPEGVLDAGMVMQKMCILRK